MAATVYLNRSEYSNTGLPTPFVFPESVIVVSDNPNDTFDVSQAFSGITSTETNPAQNGDLAAWGLSLVAGATYIDPTNQTRVAMFDLKGAQWDPNGVVGPASVESTTSSMKVFVTGSPNPLPQVAALNFSGPGDFAMINVQKDPNTNTYNPGWLSADTRTFRVLAGTSSPIGQPSVDFGTKLGGVNPNMTWNPDDPASYVQTLKTAFAANPALFDQLDNNEDAGSEISEFTTEHGQGGAPVYNFAIVRVRAEGTAAKDINAQLSVRVFTSLNAGLAYDGFNGPNYTAANPNPNPATPYPAGWPTPVQKIATAGYVNNNIICFPCFGDKRRVGAAETEQTDLTNALTLPQAQVGVHTQFGVFHMDINNPTAIYHAVQGSANPDSFAAIIHGAHCCMVAELIDPDLKTQAGMTPQNSGNLAQRNLAIDYAFNPGYEADTRTVQHAFEFVPANSVGARREGASDPHDQLLILGRNLPPGAVVELYMPGLNATKKFPPAPPNANPALGHDRHPDHHHHHHHHHHHVASHEAPLPPSYLDDDTIIFGLTQAARLSLRLSAPHRFPALLTVQLPQKQDVGARYDIDVLQLDPIKGIVVGAFRVSTPVVKARKVIGQAFANEDAATRRAKATTSGPWAKIVARQAAFATSRARSTAIEVAHEAGEVAARKVIVVLDKIEVPIKREAPMNVTAVVTEGGVRVASVDLRIPAGSPATLTLEKPLFEGVMFDTIAVTLVDATTAGAPVLHTRSWTARAGVPLEHVAESGDGPSPSHWRVWFHVIDRSGGDRR